MRLAGVATLMGHPLTGTRFRAVATSYLQTPLSTTHTATRATRFHAATIQPGFQVLYLTEDHLTALFEVEALLGSLFSAYLPNPAVVFAILPIQVHLQAVADLTLRPNLQSIRSSVQELTGDWNGYLRRNSTINVPQGHATRYRTEVPTQQLGHALFHATRLEGFITYSSRVSTRKNLIVFPAKLRAGSSIVYRDPATGQVISRIP